MHLQVQLATPTAQTGVCVCHCALGSGHWAWGADRSPCGHATCEVRSSGSSIHRMCHGMCAAERRVRVSLALSPPTHASAGGAVTAYRLYKFYLGLRSWDVAIRHDQLFRRLV